jgi:CubicO group peptidase (beta-lactamase class C family)
VELAPFTVAIQNGVQSVMVGHLAVPAYDPDAHLPASLSRSLVTGVLKERIGFQGLIVTDALVMQGISREYSVGQAVVMAMNAGNDILLTPADDDVAINVLLQAVRGGEIPMARIDSSVKKILETKQALRLNERRLVDIDRIAEVVGTRPHLALAKEIARGAITVIRNDGNLLPLGPLQKRHTLIVVVNDVDENRTDIHRPTNPAPSEPAGDYFVQCVRRRNSDVEVARISPSDAHEEHLTVLRKMARADIVLVALYVRVRTSSGSISLPPGAAHFVELAQRSPTPTVVISFGTPYVLAAFPEARALMCAYGDEEPVVEAAAEALFGEIDVRGKLPVSIGSAFPFGTGISYSRTFLRRDDPAVAGFDSQRLKRLQDVLTAAIRDSAFPCAQIVVAKDGIVVCNRSFGTYTYDLRAREIEPSTLFDLASLTKVVATTAAVMKLYDSGKIHLEDQVYSYIPQLSTGDKRRITVRDLLLHRGGFPPFRKFFEFCRTPEEILDSVYATPLVAPPGDTTIYSDLSMITLGKVVERIAGMPVDQFVEREFYGPLGMKNTMFNPPAQLWPRVAPTEIDTVWRKRLVLGTVHDENAAALGGVSGHAGLFSTASDLAVFVQMLLNGGTYGGVRYLSQKTVETFTRPAAPGQDRVLGWDLKSPEGSSAGSLFSPSSFGHTGFTGTSIWVDPERSLFVILLTNRVYPTRANLRIARVRPVVHDAVINALVQ